MKSDMWILGGSTCKDHQRSTQPYQLEFLDVRLNGKVCHPWPKHGSPGSSTISSRIQQTFRTFSHSFLVTKLQELRTKTPSNSPRLFSRLWCSVVLCFGRGRFYEHIMSTYVSLHSTDQPVAENHERSVGFLLKTGLNESRHMNYMHIFMMGHSSNSSHEHDGQ